MGKLDQKMDNILPYGVIQKNLTDKDYTIHFVGVGGVSMYSLARLTMTCGAKVSGSDREENKRTRELIELGAKIKIGHSAENIDGASLVVFSHAISPDTPELSEAKRLNIPLVSRAEFLGAMMLGYNTRIGISGSHGKSTTVAMLDAIFTHAHANPTVLSGADLPIGSPLRIGSRGIMIYEACEYKDSFLRFSPTISVGLNLELDHTDYFENIDALSTSFCKALGRAESFALINGDDENLSLIRKNIKSRVISFGFGEKNDYRYSVTAFREGGFDFTVSRFGSVIGRFELNIPGEFNIRNATAAIIVAVEYGIGMEDIAEAIRGFRGIAGRLEHIGFRYGRPVYYDYAHHPTEILASINALKSMTRRPLTVVFKPHTFSRTKSLWNDFCLSLSQANYLILTDIYSAREQEMEGINSHNLAANIDGAIYCSDSDVLSAVDGCTQGAIVLMGAGDFGRLKTDILT